MDSYESQHNKNLLLDIMPKMSAVNGFLTRLIEKARDCS